MEIPKNTTQIGEIQGNRKIFIEDYVKVNEEIKKNSTYIFKDMFEVIDLLEKQKEVKKKK